MLRSLPTIMKKKSEKTVSILPKRAREENFRYHIFSVLHCESENFYFGTGP